MGEITTKANMDIPAIVRKTVTDIGYDSSEKGFGGNTCAIMVSLDKQSTDIAMGVDKALEAKEDEMSDRQIETIGAGDQGMMFGYASNETEEFMPYPISLAHKLTLQLTKVRKEGTLTYLRPAGIIKMLSLRRPIYKQTSAYEHFGRNDLDIPWEKLDKVANLRQYING